MEKMKFARRMGIWSLLWFAEPIFSALAQVPGCPTFATPTCVQQQTFGPTGTTTLSASSVSSNVALPASGSNLTVLVVNGGSVTGYVALGTSNSVVATTSSVPILPGASIALVQGTNTYLAGITASGTAALTITSGTGVPQVVFGQFTGSTTAGSIAIVALDAATVTTGGTAVTASGAGHHNKGGWIMNPGTATVNLCVNEQAAASGTTSAGALTCIVPGQIYYIAPNATSAVSVVSSDSAHPFSGQGYN
jgi:hypothetical protein